MDTGISGEYNTVLYLNSEGLHDLVGMVDCTELLTVWRPDLCKTAQCMVITAVRGCFFVCNDVPMMHI